MSCLCNVNFQSQYAYVTSSPPSQRPIQRCDEVVNIKNYLTNHELRQQVKQQTKFLVCKNGHSLVKVKSEKKKCHFRHLRRSDVGGEPMTEWHASWQGCFVNTEIRHSKLEGSYKNRCADVLEGNNVIEFQHSPISPTEVQERQHDYGLHGRVLNWVIDGKDTVSVDYLAYSNTYLLTFKGEPWKYESFLCHDYVFVHVTIGNDDAIVRVRPNDVKSNMIDVKKYHTKDSFIRSFVEGLDIWDNSELPHCTLYHNQRGAGCGKTYESIQLLAHDNRFKHKTTFIYLTKMHSAKEVIYSEFQEQYNEGKLNTIDVSEGDHMNGKQYIINFINNITGRTCKMIIGTIDSFIYALGDKNNRHKDFFKGLLESIINGYNILPRDGSVKYARGTTVLNKECLVVIDEAQDLDCTYVRSIATIMRSTYIDAYIIGDKLQSIWGDSNIYTYLEQNDIPHTETVHSKGTNIVRRFHHSKFIPFVNTAIDFEKYGLLPVTGICDGKCKYSHDEHLSPITLLPRSDIYANESDKFKLESYIQRIIIYMNEQTQTYNYLPHNFMFIFPILSKNVLAGMLETKIQDFWINKFSSKEYQDKALRKHEYWKNRFNDKQNTNRFACLHKSEDGQPINLKESEHATRLLSIHASKGQGCEVVFLLNLSENALRLFSKDTGNLVYDSLLHVAITRQKKAIYIGLPKIKDDVHSRFGDYTSHDNDANMETLSLVNKYNTISDVCQYTIENRFDEVDTFLIAPYEYENLIPRECDKTSIIDWGHHVIRYAVCTTSMMLNIISKNNHMVCDSKQIFTVLTSIANTQVNFCNYQEYYKTLHVMKHNNKGDRKAHESIPFLRFDATNESKYSIYCEVLNRFVDRIKKKLRICLPKQKIPTLCPFEMTILHYMWDVYRNTIYADTDIMSLYEVLHTYAQCADSLNERHDEFMCMCNKEFYNGTTALSQGDQSIAITEIRKSLKCHYDIMRQVDVTLNTFFHIMSEQFNDNGKFTFNTSHSVGLHGQTDEFVLWNPSIPFIAHSDKHVIYFIIKPSFNKLNFNEVIIDSLFNKFLISECNEDSNNANRYHNKTVLVCIFTFSSPSPIVFEPVIPDNTLMLSCLEGFLKEKYQHVNMKVMDMYKYCVLTKPQRKNSIQYMLEQLEQYNKNSFPKYIIDYFTVAEDKCKTLSTAEKKTLININDLNRFLDERITRFVYGQNDEDEDF